MSKRSREQYQKSLEGERSVNDEQLDEQLLEQGVVIGDPVVEDEVVTIDVVQVVPASVESIEATLAPEAPKTAQTEAIEVVPEVVATPAPEPAPVVKPQLSLSKFDVARLEMQLRKMREATEVFRAFASEIDNPGFKAFVVALDQYQSICKAALEQQTDFSQMFFESQFELPVSKTQLILFGQVLSFIVGPMIDGDSTKLESFMAGVLTASKSEAREMMQVIQKVRRNVS